MRRKEREVTDKKEIDAIIRSCHVCRLGFADDGKVYIVPVNFGCVEEDGRYIFYFHSAKEGRKIELIRRIGRAGFEMDTDYSLKTAESACGYTAYFRSIIGQGKIEIVEDETEKRRGLHVLMQHNTGREGWEFQDKMVSAAHVLKLTVEELSAKENRKA